MENYNLPPLDMLDVQLRRDQQPSPKMLLVVALLAAFGLTLSWAQSSPIEGSQPTLVASNAAR